MRNSLFYAILLVVCVRKEDRVEYYYEDILDQLHKLMAEKKYQEASVILEKELSMPYIPKESEAKLLALYQECRSECQYQKAQRYHDEEDVEALLNGSLEEQFMAVELLKKSNLRNHLDIIEQYLCHQPHGLVSALLIDAMMEQKIADEMHMIYNGMEISFLPCYIEAPMRAKGAITAASALCDWFEDENPTFLKLCMESLIQECYLHLPFSIDEDEGIPLALSIVYYVKAAEGDQDSMDAFLKAKGLEKELGFALLLNKHGI